MPLSRSGYRNPAFSKKCGRLIVAGVDLNYDLGVMSPTG